MTSEPASGPPPEFRSGFVTVVGRPNVGKSTLVNRMVGAKVSIVSARPQTTRTQVRGVRTTPSSQIVFLDTPGIHRPRTLLGERTNRRSVDALAEVDVVCHVVDASSAYGPGDRFVAELVHRTATPRVLVVNKVDRASSGEVAGRLGGAQDALGPYDAYVPVSAHTGEGVDALVVELEDRLAEGPLYYPDGVLTDQPEAVLVAELVREKLLAVTRDELPHSLAVVAERVERDPTEEPRGGRASPGDDDVEELLRFRVVVWVERDSQKGIVIGRRGLVIRDAGTAARLELEALLGAHIHLDTTVKVNPHWQRRPAALDRLGL